MSVCQLGHLKRKRDRFLSFPLSGKILDDAIATGFIKDLTDLRYAITRKVTRKTMVVEFVLMDVKAARESGPNTVLKQVFVLTFPYDPNLWIDTTSD